MTITNGYCTKDELKGELNIPATVVEYDTRLEYAISAASRQFDAHTGRYFYQDATLKTREFFAEDANNVMVTDISTTTGLVVKGDTGDDGSFAQTYTITTNFVLLPRNADQEYPARPWTQIRLIDRGVSWFPTWTSGRAGVQVTAKFGWPAIPDDVRKACLIQATQLFKSSDATFGAVQLSVDGSPMRLGSRLHPMAEALLARYVVQP